MLLLRDFNKRFTIRRLSMFGEPTVLPLSNLTFPKNSVLHYFDPKSTEIGPPGTLYKLNENDKPPRVRHHQYFPTDGTIGLPIENKTELKETMWLYHRRWNSMGRFKSMAVVENEAKILLIENYLPINRKYRYNERVNLWYDIAHNQLNTIITGISNTLGELSDRQHYIPLTLPNVLPAKAAMKKMIFNKSKQVWKDLGSYEMLFLLELYAFIGDTDERETSRFSKFTPRELKHTNFVLEFRGNFVIFNLGEIDGWRREGKEGKVSPADMQKRFRKTIQTILETPPVCVTVPREIANDSITTESDISYEESVDYQDDETAIDDEILRFNEQVSNSPEDEGEIIAEEEIVEEVDIEQPDDTEGFIARELAKIKKTSVTRFDRFSEKFAQVFDLESPYGGTYQENIIFTDAEKELIDVKLIKDDDRFTVESWNGSKSKVYGEKYNQEIMKKDIIRTIYGAQQLGFVIENHTMEEELTVSGHKEHHKLSVTMLDGTKATLPFTIPVTDKHGYWHSNAVKYTMRKQRVDAPIRKVGPTNVALTTFYGKCFIRVNEHKVNNWTRWITDEIALAGSSEENNKLSDISFSDVYDNLATLPREYSLIATEIDSFNSKGYHYNFDHKRIDEVFGTEVVEKLKKDDFTPVAISRDDILVMDKSSAMYRSKGGNITPIDKLSTLLDLPESKVPKEFTEVKILSNYIPLVLILAYYNGLEALLNYTKTEYNLIPPGEKINEAGIVIKLKEGRLEIITKSRQEELLYNALLRYKDITKTLSLRDLNTRAAYPLLLSKDGIGSEYTSEFINIERGFVDALHRDKLIKMGEPTNFIGLLHRSNELMDDAQCPNETDFNHQNILTHQRIPGHIYKEICSSVRRYHNAPPNFRKLEMKPKAVWSAIDGDTSVLTAQDSTPLQSVKEADVFTFGGSGGRQRRSMVKSTRVFSETDLGIVSGDTVDSTDVGITAMLSNNPNISDMFGNVSTTQDVMGLEHGELMSFCNSISPDTDTEDSKRSMFAGIQYASGTAAQAAVCPSYRTPSHLLVAHRASDYYAVAAEQDGVVEEVTTSGIIIKYKDGTKAPLPLGRWYGSYEGGTFPHDMVTTFKVGDKVKERDILTYASNHFEPDFFKPRQVNWRAGVMANVVLINSEESFEDSNEISTELAEKQAHLGTKIIEEVVSVTDNIIDMVKVGSVVDYDTPMFVIDASEEGGTLSEASMEVLSEISANAPKAGIKGVLDRIEVIYNSEYDEMSDTVRTIVKRSDRQRKLAAENSPTPLPITGLVNEEFRVKGQPMREGLVTLKFYVTHKYTPMGGSKLVFGNQMKSVIHGTMVGKNYTEDGRDIDAKFGREGIDDRIVGSFHHIGVKGLFCFELGRELREIREAG